LIWGKEPAKPAGRAGAGFSYQHDEVPAVPWSIHIVKMDRSATDLELHTTLGKGSTYGLTTLSEQLKLLSRELGRPVAAINGDFFRKEDPYPGDPKGLQILQGELVSDPCEWSCFWIDVRGEPRMTNVVARFRATLPTGESFAFGLNEERLKDDAVLYTPAIGVSTRTSGGRELVLEHAGSGPWLPLRPGQSYAARVREVREAGDTALSAVTMVLSLGSQLAARMPKPATGTIVQIVTGTLPDLQGVQTAMGGGPPLVSSGMALDVQTNRGRHPRTAIGWNKTHLFLVEVDGRQRGLSVGMTLPELANYMAKLGCEEALNLDGGASATCWVLGHIMNSPSAGRERDMANALVIIQKEKK
jgi:hypothetical protein